MSYFEKSKVTDTTGVAVNPAQEESLTLLRRIFQALKPLGQVTGSGSNRLSIDINNITAGALTSLGTVTTVTTVTTVSTVTSCTTVGTVGSVTNLAGIGGVAAFDQMKAQSRTAYNTGNRSNISFT